MTGGSLTAYVATWYAALARAQAVDVTAVLVFGAVITAMLRYGIDHAALPSAVGLGLVGAEAISAVEEEGRLLAGTASQVSNLRAGYNGYYGDWEISSFVGVNNLFDESYYNNIRINAFGGRYFEPAPERNAYIGLTIRKQL